MGTRGATRARRGYCQWTKNRIGDGFGFAYVEGVVHFGHQAGAHPLVPPNLGLVTDPNTLKWNFGLA